MSNTIVLLRFGAWAGLWSGAGPGPASCKGGKAGTRAVTTHRARETRDQVNWRAASALRTRNAAYIKRCGRGAPSAGSDYVLEENPFIIITSHIITHGLFFYAKVSEK